MSSINTFLFGIGDGVEELDVALKFMSFFPFCADVQNLASDRTNANIFSQKGKFLTKRTNLHLFSN